MLTEIAVYDHMIQGNVLVDLDQVEEQQGAVRYMMQMPASEQRYVRSLYRRIDDGEWEEVRWRGDRVTTLKLRKWIKAEIKPVLDLPPAKGTRVSRFEITIPTESDI